MNYTLQKFIDKLVEELKTENEEREYYYKNKLDIPFIISSLYQSFENNEEIYKEFILDLENYSDYYLTSYEPYDDCEMTNVFIYLCEYNTSDDCYESKYIYELDFAYDERNWGYCECTPDMPDYREDKHCCGHGCDADFCRFTLNKKIQVASDTWHGDEHDYWEFEDEFYKKEKELSKKKLEENKRKEIESLKDSIVLCIKRLEELGVSYEYRK